MPKLDALLEALERPVKRGFLRRTQASAVKGLYIWGGVGGGKSYLMDLFASSLAVAVRRVHFHAFMQEVQAGLHLARQTNAKDALVPVCQAIAKDIRVLALDEMQIKDIADAMISTIGKDAFGTIGIFPPKNLTIMDIEAPERLLPSGGPKTPPGLIVTNSND